MNKKNIRASQCPTVENSSNVRLMGGFQTSYQTASEILNYLSAKTANPGPGNVQFQTAMEIGAKGPVDVAKTLTTVEKTISFLNRPNQLNTLAKWVFGDPITVNVAAKEMIFISSQGIDNTRVNAATDSFKIEQTADNGTTWTDIVSISLPATINDVIAAVNAVSGWYAQIIYGDPTQNYSFEGIVPLSYAELIPASPMAGTKAQISMYVPMNGCPNYMSFLYELFSNPASTYREDIGAQVLTFTVDMPKDGLSSCEIGYLARQNIIVKEADIPSPIGPSDQVPLYKGSEGLYNIALGGNLFSTIDSVSSSFTNDTTNVKNWSGYQIQTAPKTFNYQQQVNAWLTPELYAYITNLYETRLEQESFSPTITYIYHQQYVDPDNQIPYMFGYIMPKAKISAAPELTVEAGSDIPCNFTLTPTEFEQSADISSLYFFVISEA